MERSCFNEELEKIDEVLTEKFKTAMEKVEGMKHNTPCSHEKEKTQSMVLCCKNEIERTARKSY